MAVEPDGDVSWQWGDYFIIAETVRQAALECGVRVRWGGGWFVLNEVADIEAAQAAYVERKKRENKKPFLDGPHFELPVS